MFHSCVRYQPAAAHYRGAKESKELMAERQKKQLRGDGEPVLCVALKPFRCTDASDLKTMNILLDEARSGCGSLLPQKRPSVVVSVVAPSYTAMWS